MQAGRPPWGAPSTGLHWPRLPSIVHDSQIPGQAPPQHTPSTQNPEPHWAARSQACPTVRSPVPPSDTGGGIGLASAPGAAASTAADGGVGCGGSGSMGGEPGGGSVGSVITVGPPSSPATARRPPEAVASPLFPVSARSRPSSLTEQAPSPSRHTASANPRRIDWGMFVRLERRA